MKQKTNWYWLQLRTKHIVIISTCNIIYPCLDVSDRKKLQAFPGLYSIKNNDRLCIDNKNFIADAYRDYILDEIEFRDHIQYGIQIHNEDK